MYLMDMVAHCAVKVSRSQRGYDPTLRGYIDLGSRLVGCPRYLLDAAATRTTVEIGLGRPKVTREAMMHLRVPYRRMWVEWEDINRQKLRDSLDDKPMAFAELRPLPGRVGFLLDADEAGRKGTATWAWTTPGGPPDIPNVGAVQAFFDLDKVHHLPQERIEGLRGGNFLRFWDDNPVQQEALLDIWRTAVHEPASWAQGFWNATGNPELARALSLADVVGEYIQIWCVLLLLTASRPIVDTNFVSLARLNKHRRKKGQVPLLDHTEISLRLTPQAQRPVVRGALGYSRKPPRIHMVSSYLARRGARHWIVQPYMRGSGEQIHRVTHVKG
jgi:hypothetical protein